MDNMKSPLVEIDKPVYTGFAMGFGAVFGVIVAHLVICIGVVGVLMLLMAAGLWKGLQ